MVLINHLKLKTLLNYKSPFRFELETLIRGQEGVVDRRLDVDPVSGVGDRGIDVVDNLEDLPYVTGRHKCCFFCKD